MPRIISSEKFVITDGETRAIDVLAGDIINISRLKEYSISYDARREGGVEVLPIPDAVFGKEDFSAIDNLAAARELFPHLGMDAYRIQRAVKLGNLYIAFNYTGRGDFQFHAYTIDQDNRKLLPMIQLPRMNINDLLFSAILPFIGEIGASIIQMSALPSTCKVKPDSHYDAVLRASAFPAEYGDSLALKLFEIKGSLTQVEFAAVVDAVLHKEASTIKNAFRRWALGESFEFDIERAVANFNIAYRYFSDISLFKAETVDKLRDAFNKKWSKTGLVITAGTDSIEEAPVASAAASGGAGSPGAMPGSAAASGGAGSSGAMPPSSAAASGGAGSSGAMPPSSAAASGGAGGSGAMPSSAAATTAGKAAADAKKATHDDSSCPWLLCGGVAASGGADSSGAMPSSAAATVFAATTAGKAAADAKKTTNDDWLLCL